MSGGLPFGNEEFTDYWGDWHITGEHIKAACNQDGK